MSKHTPGPWNCLRASAAGRSIVCAENQPKDICVLSNRDKTQSEINANAQLIAAAPELLDALKLLASYGDVFAYHKDSENPYRKALAAIAKAEGKQ